MLRKTFVIVALFGLVPVGAAQQAIVACETQREIGQVIGSGGDITPQGCRKMTISVLESEGRQLCLIDFSGEGEGIVDQLRKAAVSEQWWVRCEELQAAAR
jgi:hypothetical protein